MSRLPTVEKMAATFAIARSALEDQIRQAHAEGESLRAIAEAAKMSHEQVRRIVQRSA